MRWQTRAEKNGEAVGAFLEEVSGTDLKGWRTFLELESSTDEFGAAIDAVHKAPLSACARSAVHSAGMKRSAVWAWATPAWGEAQCASPTG